MSHSAIQNAEKISDSECLTIDGTSIPTFPRSQGSGNIVEDGRDKMGGCYKILSSGHDLAVAHINSKHLWLAAQDLY